MERPTEDFIQSLSPEQMHKLDAVIWAIPDHQLIMEMISDGVEEVMQRKGLAREDVCQIEADAYGIFACALLKAFKRRVDED